MFVSDLLWTFQVWICLQFITTMFDIITVNRYYYTCSLQHNQYNIHCVCVWEMNVSLCWWHFAQFHFQTSCWPRRRNTKQSARTWTPPLPNSQDSKHLHPTHCSKTHPFMDCASRRSFIDASTWTLFVLFTVITSCSRCSEHYLDIHKFSPKFGWNRVSPNCRFYSIVYHSSYLLC